MQYKLADAKAQGLPYSKILDPTKQTEKVYGMDVLIKTSIVGQTHTGFENLDMGFCPIEKTDTIDAVELKLTAFASAYVSTKYPNT